MRLTIACFLVLHSTVNVSGQPVTDSPSIGESIDIVTDTIHAVTDVNARLGSGSLLSTLEDNKNSDSLGESIDTVSVISSSEALAPHGASDNEEMVHQFSLSEQVESFTNYPLHPSAVVFTASNYSTNNPLDNLKDFSSWNTSDIHDFHINHENDIEGNEFTYFDQLAVESEHTSNTVAHTILANDSLPLDDSDSEHLNYNVSVSTASSFSEEVSRVWITPTLLSYTVSYTTDRAKEEETTTAPNYFTTGVNPSREPELANDQESLEQVTDNQTALSIRDNPSLTHYRTVYHDIMAPLTYDAHTNSPTTDVARTNQFTPGVLSVEEVNRKESETHTRVEATSAGQDFHIHQIADEEKPENYFLNDHFDLVTTDNDHKLDHEESSSRLSTNNPDPVTQMYNLDLYEVVTSQIDPETDYYLDGHADAGFTAHEYDSINTEYKDVDTDSNFTDPEREDVDLKYATFLENLHNKYEEQSDKPDENRGHTPKLFEDALSVLVEKKDELPKLFDQSLQSQHQFETLEHSDFSLEENADQLPELFESPLKPSNDMEHPLISLMKIEPHAMRLLVKPRKFEPHTMVRLMYERVPRNKPALQQHLDDPVIEYIHLYRLDQEYYLNDLPMGKYIVCGDAQINGHVFQSNCFETVIDRLDNNMLQGGVIGVIAVALLIVFAVIVYAIYHRLVLSKRKDTERQ